MAIIRPPRRYIDQRIFPANVEGWPPLHSPESMVPDNLDLGGVTITNSPTAIGQILVITSLNPLQAQWQDGGTPEADHITVSFDSESATYTFSGTGVVSLGSHRYTLDGDNITSLGNNSFQITD